MRRLPARQVHLDFHTSEYMEKVGSQFDKKQFQEVLKEGHVNSITVFGKCHHGYHYFPTTVGTIHPGLKPGKDLAGEMMEACHEIGVFAPLYLTLGWSVLDAREHTEWIARNRDGSWQTTNYDLAAPDDAPRPECSWINLCSAGSYRDYLYAMTREVCERYEQLDGLFFDIVFVSDVCYCDDCRRGMREMGLNPDRTEDAKEYYQIQKKITLDGLREILFETHPDASIFFNSGGADIHLPQWHYASTHFEMEDLPTTWGGYDKMPMRSRYFAGKGKDYLGMTGKFHRAWGEFGGYKMPEALRYECAAMLANGARVSIGDQLHPLGRMDMQTYRNIGKAFSYVEQIEEYCFDTTETARLGVMVSTDSGLNEAMAKLLLDCQIDFDVVHGGADLLRFDTVILPDRYRLEAEWGAAFDAFAAQGGKVLMLGGSGLKTEAEEFAFDVPFSYLGRSEYDKDYFEVLADGEEEIPAAPILCYTSAHRVSLCAACTHAAEPQMADAQVLARIKEPYFSRTYGKYCSHYNTPYGEDYADYPGAVQRGNILYIAHELADMYAKYGVTWFRRYFKRMLRRLYQADCIEVKMPAQGRIHFVKREGQNQYVLHLMYASPIQRGGVSVLEDFPILRNVEAAIHVPETVKRAVLVPQMEELPLQPLGNTAGCLLNIPELCGHQMVVLEY